jgi:ABC-type transport system involved in cytochrome bd biosynthesis fused ATPase/permease subunit
MDPQATAYIVLGVILIATFISVFFFTYVSKVEGEVVKSQMTNIVDNLSDGSQLLLTPDQQNQIGTLIQTNLTVPDMSAEDAEVKANNDALKKKSIKIFGVIILSGLAILLYLWHTHKLNMGEIFKYSIIILLLVALTEYLFVSQISRNYQIVDPNYVRYLIANNLRNYAKSP